MLTVVLVHLLSYYYLTNKQSLHVHSQDLEIPTLIGKKEKFKLPTIAITKS